MGDQPEQSLNQLHPSDPLNIRLKPRIDQYLLNAYMSSNASKGHFSPLQIFSTCACQHRIWKKYLTRQQVCRIVQAYVAVPAPPRDTDEHMVFSASSFIGPILHITGILPSLVATLVFSLYFLLRLGRTRPSSLQSSF